jgi:hypothetical protein
LKDGKFGRWVPVQKRSLGNRLFSGRSFIEQDSKSHPFEDLTCNGRMKFCNGDRPRKHTRLSVALLSYISKLERQLSPKLIETI